MKDLNRREKNLIEKERKENAILQASAF